MRLEAARRGVCSRLSRPRATAYPRGMDTPSVPALKEWAVIVDALMSGASIVDLRKGGIREEGRHFALRAPRLWLYSSFEHQKPALLKPEWHARLDATVRVAPPAGRLRVEAYADIVATATIASPEGLGPIDGELIWTREYAEQRLHWKPKHPLWVLALRVHRLDAPLLLPWHEEYRGCTSWVDLLDLPHDPTALASTPALDDAAFEARLAALQAALPQPFAPPALAA
jgi:hypothetical protein